MTSNKPYSRAELETAKLLHRTFCDRACPPDSELHVADRKWAADARYFLRLASAKVRAESGSGDAT